MHFSYTEPSILLKRLGEGWLNDHLRSFYSNMPQKQEAWPACHKTEFVNLVLMKEKHGLTQESEKISIKGKVLEINKSFLKCKILQITALLQKGRLLLRAIEGAPGVECTSIHFTYSLTIQSLM